MPNITQYTNQDDQLHPSEIGAEAYAQAGRRIGSFYHQMGQDVGQATKNAGDVYQDHVTQQELTRQNASLATLQLGLSNSWNQTTADAVQNGNGDNPSVAANFRAQSVEPALQSWAQGFSTKQGQAYAQQRVAEMRQHFYEKTAVDQATMTGHAAVQDSEDMINGYAGTSRIDPASSDYNIGAAKNGIEATIAAHSGMWSPEQQSMYRTEMTEKAQQQIAKGHYAGLVESNPQQALAELNSGKYANYLPEGTDQSIVIAATSQIRLQTEQQKAAAMEQQRQQKAAVQEKLTGGVISMLGNDGSVHVTPQSIAAIRQAALMPGADQADVKGAMEFVSAANTAGIDHKYTPSDPHVYASFASRLGIPAGMPGALTKTELVQATTAAIQGKPGLSPTDMHELSDGIDRVQNDPSAKQAQTILNKYIEDVKPAILKSTLTGVDATSSIMYAQYQRDAYQQFMQAVAAGGKPQDVAMRLTDPRQPGSLASQISHYQIDNKSGMANLRAYVAPGGKAPVPVAATNPQIDKTALTPDQSAWLAAHRKQ